MARRLPSGGRDNWGRRPRGPFQVWLRADPRRAAMLSVTITVGLIVFWIMVFIGLIAFILLALG
jgi:hypothetical protein